jgi:hypothetical protein
VFALAKRTPIVPTCSLRTPIAKGIGTLDALQGLALKIFE